ncbi:MAG: hypothetical protein LPK25_09335 [Cyclobacteriaceae bacterium]|nr:hypothetical protein [Cyclobacteriaceae bacterium]
MISCKKEVPTYPFSIQVVSQNGTPIQNAMIEATAPVADALPDFIGYSDVEGFVRFEYDFEAVLLITASKGNPPVFFGCDYIKLKADETVSLKIIMTEYDPQDSGC